MKRLFRLSLLLCAPLLAAPDNSPAASPAPAKPSQSAPEPAEQILRPPEAGRFKPLFQPFRTDLAALSPDGKYLAYSIREGETVSVVVIEIDHPEKIKTRVQVINDDGATPMLAVNQAEKTPARINWMGWVTASRLVVETNHIFARQTGTDSAWQSWRGSVLGFDADGTNAKLLASPEQLAEFSSDTGEAGDFSIRRGNTSGFDSRVTTPDQPLPAVADAPSDTADDSAPDQTVAAPAPNLGAPLPRTLRVFDFDAQQPGAVTLVATGAPRSTGSRSIGFYSLDGSTGRLKDITDTLVPGNRSPLLDRQGRPRVILPNSLLARFPLLYQYLGARGLSRPHPLDELTGLTGFAVSPDNYFGERAIPFGFDEDPNILYYASNLGRDTFGLYSLDLTTRQRGKLTLENPAYDLIGPPTTAYPDSHDLIFDRFTHHLIGVRYENALRTAAWLRPEWQQLQSLFEHKFPGRSVELVAWDQEGHRFLLSTQGPADPGAFFVFDAPTGRLIEFARRAPWIDAAHRHVTLPFSYATPEAGRVSGLVTVPQQPRLKPIPMVVLCPNQPWLRVTSDFQSDVQALADMGFVVVQLNGRGAWGLGLKQRRSITAGYDLVQVEDLATSLTQLEKIFNVNPRRVAVMGRGHGGFIALRAIQTHPDKFRCAIALDAPVNLGDWLDEQHWSDDDVQPHLTRAWLGDAARLKAAPLTSHPEAITQPILLLNYPGPDGAPRHASYLAARNFAGAVRRHGTTAEFDDLSTDYQAGLPAARAEVFDRIEQFLDTHVYDFDVKLHELKILK